MQRWLKEEIVTFLRGRVTQEDWTSTDSSSVTLAVYSPGWSSTFTAVKYLPRWAKPAWGTQTEPEETTAVRLTRMHSMTSAAASSVWMFCLSWYMEKTSGLSACAALKAEVVLTRLHVERTAVIEHVQIDAALFKSHTGGSLTACHAADFQPQLIFLALHNKLRWSVLFLLKMMLHEIPTKIKWIQASLSLKEFFVSGLLWLFLIRAIQGNLFFYSNKVNFN